MYPQEMQVKRVSFKNPEAPLQFAQSLKETGFAVLRDHPIDASLIQEAFREWERFFANPKKTELTFTRETQSGYFPFKSEKAKDQRVFDLKEFFHYYPSRIELPAEARNATPKLFAALESLSATLLGWIDDHTPTEIRKQYSMPLRDMIKNSEETLLRPIHYPPITGGEEQGAIRAAAHEDINLITLLPAATTPGLQVKDIHGRWHDVSCDPGELAINAGDMLQMSSQGYYVSTTHRVVNPNGPEAKLPRYSMPLFLHPRHDVRLSPEHTSRSYLMQRLGEIGLLK